MILKGTVTAGLPGCYLRLNNPQGQTLSLRRKQVNQHPVARAMMAAMRNLAAQWQALSPADKQSWPDAHSGLFIGRRGNFIIDDYGYFGRLAHLLPAAGAALEYLRGPHVPGLAENVTFHDLTFNAAPQTLAVTFNNQGPATGSARSGLKIFQVHPNFVDNPRPQDYTQQVFQETPFPDGNHPILRVADCAWPTVDNAEARILAEWFDEGDKEACNKTPFD